MAKAIQQKKKEKRLGKMYICIYRPINTGNSREWTHLVNSVHLSIWQDYTYACVFTYMILK